MNENEGNQILQTRDDAWLGYDFVNIKHQLRMDIQWSDFLESANNENLVDIYKSKFGVLKTDWEIREHMLNSVLPGPNNESLSKGLLAELKKVNIFHGVRRHTIDGEEREEAFIAFSSRKAKFSLTRCGSL